MSFNAGVIAFLRDAFFNVRDRRSRKVFFITKLTGPNDINEVAEVPELQADSSVSLHDMGIETYCSPWTKKTHINVIFRHGESENATYWLLEVAANFKKTTQSLWNFKEINEEEFMRRGKNMIRDISIDRKINKFKRKYFQGWF